MASLKVNNKYSSYKDISKDSDKVEQSTKDYQMSSSDDYLKFQQDQCIALNYDELINKKEYCFNDNASNWSKESLPKIMRRVINTEKHNAIDKYSIDYSSPILYEIVSKRIKNRMNIKPISGNNNKCNYASIEISPLHSKQNENAIENENGYNESFGSRIKQKDSNEFLIDKDYLINPVKHNSKVFDQSKIIDSTNLNSHSQHDRIKVIKRKKVKSQVSNIDMEFLLNNSSTTDIINERILPINRRKNNDNKDKIQTALLNQGNQTNEPQIAGNTLKYNQIEIGNFDNNYLKRYDSNKTIQIRPLFVNNVRYNHTKPECFQCFGSNVARQLFVDKQKLDTPGPGAYFHSQSDRIRPILRIVKKGNEKGPLLQTNNNRVNSEYDKSILGPGSYDINCSFIKKSNSNVDKFGSCERRFEQSIDFDLPVPGSHNSSEEKEKKSHRNNKLYFSREQNIIQKKLEQATQRLIKHNKQQEFLPGSGEYSPEQYNSIEHKIKSKNNYFKHKIAKIPFSSQKERFIYNSEDKRDYGTYKSDFDKKQQANCKSDPFLFSHNKDCKLNHNLFPLPGQLIKDSYFDWNKKSFNIKYL